MKSNGGRALGLLGVLGVLGGGLWRLEVEWRGWEGLGWIGYFHGAIPGMVGLFLGWLWWVCDLEPRGRRVAFLGCAGVYAGVGYGLARASLVALYAPAWYPSGPGWRVALEQGWFLLLFPVFPLGVWGLGRAFGSRLGWWWCVLGWLGWVVSFPLTCVVLGWVGHKGGADVLHAIKSGGVFVPLMVSLGLPWGGLVRKNKK